MGSIYYVDFLEKTLLRVEKDPPPESILPTQESMDKFACFHRCLAVGKVTVMFKTKTDGVILPDSISDREVQAITFSTNFATPDVAADDSGVSQTLSFNGISSKVFVPWEAIISIASPKATLGREWEDGKPALIATIKAPILPEVPPEPPNRA